MNKLLIVSALTIAGLGMASEKEVDVSRLNCRTTVGMVHTSFGDTCYMDEVMVGIRQGDPLQLRCGKLQTTCVRAEAENTQASDAPRP